MALTQQWRKAHGARVSNGDEPDLRTCAARRRDDEAEEEFELQNDRQHDHACPLGSATAPAPPPLGAQPLLRRRRAPSHCAQPLLLRLELAASAAADCTALDHSGQGWRPSGWVGRARRRCRHPVLRARPNGSLLVGPTALRVFCFARQGQGRASAAAGYGRPGDGGTRTAWRHVLRARLSS